MAAISLHMHKSVVYIPNLAYTARHMRIINKYVWMCAIYDN